MEIETIWPLKDLHQQFGRRNAPAQDKNLEDRLNAPLPQKTPVKSNQKPAKAPKQPPLAAAEQPPAKIIAPNEVPETPGARVQKTSAITYDTVTTGPGDPLSPNRSNGGAGDNNGAGGAGANAVDLNWIFSLLWDNKALIFFLAALTTFLVTLLLLVLPAKFRATSEILIDTRQAKVIDQDTVLPGISGNLSEVESQSEILRSTRMAAKVITALGLYPEKSGFSLSPWSGAGEISEKWQNPGADNLPPFWKLQKFAESLSVQRKGLSNVLSISFTDKSPVRAAKVANLIAQTHVKQDAEDKRSATFDANNWLGMRVKQLQKKVEKAERKVRLYRKKHKLVDIGASSLNEKEISAVTGQVLIAKGNAAKAQARLDEVKQLLKTPESLTATSEALESKVIIDLRRQMALVARRYSNISSRLLPRHPRVKAVLAEKNRLKRQLQNELKRIKANARSQFSMAQSQVKQLSGRLGILKSKFAKRQDIELQLAELNRDASTSGALYKSLLKRFKETAAQENLDTPNQRMIASAVPSPDPIMPHRPIALLLAFLAGLVFASIYILARGAAKPHSLRPNGP